MATGYGGWIGGDDWRAVVEVTIANDSNGTSCTVTVRGKCQSVYTTASYMSGTATSNASGGTTSNSQFAISPGSTTTFKTNTFTVQRGTSAKTITCKATATSSSGSAYGAQTSTAAVSVTIPALASYIVVYDANKPSAASGSVAGLPANQTKYYGINLALATAVPTLALYNFMGWNTAANGTGTAYAPGGTYSGNQAVTLYAQWELAYSYPAITGFTVIRCDQDGMPAEDGTYAKVEFSWSVDATADNGTNTGRQYIIAAKSVSAPAYTPYRIQSLSATSGTVSEVIGGAFSDEASYDVMVTVTDNHVINGAYGATSQYLTLSEAFSYFTTSPNHGVAVGKQATQADLFDVALDTYFEEDVAVAGTVSAHDFHSDVQELAFTPGSGIFTVSFSTAKRRGDNVEFTVQGTLTSAKAAWSGFSSIGTLSVKPVDWMSFVGLAQVDGTATPVLCQLNPNTGEVEIRTLNAGIPAGSWMWLGGNYTAGT